MALIPQKREFFALYNRAAENTIAISRILIRLLEEFPERKDENGRAVKELEHEGDRITHEIVDLVNRTFVTPFDRDDMYRLASVLDDVCATTSTRLRERSSATGFATSARRRSSRRASSSGRR